MLRVPNHPSVLAFTDLDHRIAVFDMLRLNLPEGRSSQLQLTVTGFNTAGDSTADSIGVTVYVDKEKVIKLPDQTEVKHTVSIALKPNDHLKTSSFDLTLERIIRPSVADRNPGWAEFTVQINEATKD
jgi:hypothetical protein